MGPCFSGSSCFVGSSPNHSNSSMELNADQKKPYQDHMSDDATMPIYLTGPPSIHVSSAPEPKMVVTSEIQSLLNRSTDWDFELFVLEEKTKKSCLLYLGFNVINQFDGPNVYHSDPAVFAKWLWMIEGYYHVSNSYHNGTHAADVLHATAIFLTRLKARKILKPLHEISALVAAIVHDVDHPARTNAFMVNSRSHLSFLYNDISVLENHHASVGFMLTLREKSANILSNLSKEEFKEVRSLIVSMVLATDMKRHNNIMESFSNSTRVFPQGKKNLRTSIASNEEKSAALMPILEMLIKCADVSNPVRPIKYCVEWANRIRVEYCQQVAKAIVYLTEDEKKLGITLTMPFYDWQSCDLPRVQLSFMKLLIMPLFKLWTSFCDIPESITCLKENYVYWGKMSKREAISAAKKQAYEETSPGTSPVSFEEPEETSDVINSPDSGKTPSHSRSATPMDGAPSRRNNDRRKTVNDVIGNLSSK